MRVSRMEYEILNLLRSREMYGLEMVKASPILKRGTVYVTLDRMTDKGYVKSRTEDNPKEAGMPRRIYSITALGQRVMQAADAEAAVLSGGELAWGH